MKLIILFAVCFNSVIISQNLVPNPSFEELNDTISGFINSSSEFEKKIKNWVVPNMTTPDVITPDFAEGYTNPPLAHSGSNTIGIQCSRHRIKKNNYWSECIGVKLINPLLPNHTYYVEYWIRRSNCTAPSMDINEYMNKNFGILFTSDSIKTTNPGMILGPPHIKGDSQLYLTNKKWIKISKYFTPHKKYNFLYLGQFREEGDEDPIIFNSYYVIDDVKVIEVADFATLDKNIKLPIGSKIPLNHVHFVSGTTKLSDIKSYNILKELVIYLNSHPNIRIRINGYTDSIGSKEYNQLLSLRRAKTIAEILIKKGINSKRLDWKGFGEENPITNNNTAKGRLKNRRVEFEIIE